MATVVIQIIQNNGTFTAPPSVQQVQHNDFVKWVPDASVTTFRVKFKNNTPFEDGAFDIDDQTPHKATKTGPFTYSVHATGADGAPWSFGGCPEIDVS